VAPNISVGRSRFLLAPSTVRRLSYRRKGWYETRRTVAGTGASKNRALPSSDVVHDSCPHPVMLTAAYLCVLSSFGEFLFLPASFTQLRRTSSLRSLLVLN